MKHDDLNNKIALITGGTSGIGYAAAKELIEHGAEVIITGRDQKALEKAAYDLGVIPMAADQSDLADIESLAKKVKERFGKIDILFLNAGTTTFSSVEDATEAHYDQLMDVNLKGPFFIVSKFIPLINDGGSIIFNTSVNAVLAMPGSAVYSAGKAALSALNRVLAKELAPRKIRTNVVAPGPVETPIYDKLGLDQTQKDDFSNLLGQKVLLGRFGQAYEIAKVVRFLASEDASFITGTEITVDGGLTVNAVSN